MKLRTDIKNEKRNNILVILFIILFFTGAKLFSQTTDLARKTYLNPESNKETTYLFPNEGLSFVSQENNADSIYISIMADSVSEHQYMVNFYAFFPETIDIKTVTRIVIEFDDNSIFMVDAFRVEKENNYVEYDISKSLYVKLITVKFNRIIFNEKTQVTAKSNKDYFMSFFNAIANK